LEQALNGLQFGLMLFLLASGLTLVFGIMDMINLAHGALYMVGAFFAWMLLNYAGINYWMALVIAPIGVALIGVLIEKTMLRWLQQLDHLYGLLLTFGLALILEGIFREFYGSSGLPYELPQVFRGVFDLGFMMLPKYRVWVIVVSIVLCFFTWFVIEKTKLGAYLRAGTENPNMVKAFGINVPLMVTLTYAFGVGLAGLAGVMAAPIYQVSPLMGSNIIIVVFAVVVIGGMGSILGSIVTGLALGLIEGLAKVFFAEVSSTVVFIIMAIVLLIRPAGLFGREK
jgi:branched-chain amino acid transport system permease protein